MMQRLVDSVLGIAKESIKAISQESFNHTVRLINGFSAIILAVLPAKSSLEGIQGWELRPTLRGPRLPSWMEDGVSSFNSFISDYESESESEYESEYEFTWDEDSLPPASPCSQTSHISRASSFGKHRRHSSFLKRTLRKLFWPMRIWGSGENLSSTRRGSSRGSHSSGFVHAHNSSSGSFHHMYNLARSHISGVKDYMMPKQSGDRRRGIVEDLQLWVELFIEQIFEVVQNFIHHCLSPFETMKLLFRWIFFTDPNQEGDDVVYMATLGDTNSTLQKQVVHGHSLNTDGRTCEDVITSLGYPYEALRVTTTDGHILLLERIPRRNSQKVLYLQHGVLDSSLGWVSNGVVGSQAFAAYDQGYDVFLGNFRGLASREHVDQHISARRYWQYSVNEHGTQDIPAMLTKIHEIKMSDLEDIMNDVSMSNAVNCDGERLPYSLCGVAHSLGGASILMYVVTCRLENKPHYLSRLILLSPAGFHEDAPVFCSIMKYVMPVIAPFVGPLVPGLYIPTRFLRAVFNKLARDFQKYPAVGGLVQTLFSYMVGGDSSNWVGAIGMTHYNMNDMPGISFLVGQHLAQMMRKKKFTMFDFGSVAANIEAYGTREPLDIGAHYNVIDIPVDVVAGKRDYIIPRSMVRRHYQTLKDAGCRASYDEFKYAHLDFTFSHKEELQAYVMSRLLLVTPPRLNSTNLHPPPSVRVRSMKKSNSLPSKSLKKSRRFVDGEVEDTAATEGEKPQISIPNGKEDGSSMPPAVGDNLEEENLPYQLASSSQAELGQIHSHTQEILSNVTAGSIETDSHEESFRREAVPFEPQSFDDSSLFAFPSGEVVSIMERRASKGGRSGTVSTKSSKLNMKSNSATTSSNKVSPRSSAFSRLRNHLFKKSSSNARPLNSVPQTCGHICTSNCWHGGDDSMPRS